MLAKYVLPSEMGDYFEIEKIEDLSDGLHFYLEEKNIVPEEYKSIDLKSNGFYESSAITDFPLRDKKVILHVRRRRWTDDSCKSYSRNWKLTAEGTRYSIEFASFLKEALGYIPDTRPIT
jgi:hypothetical protein